ncbi:OLC1v1001451C1 [Oldenlandia corymbosa var. corymbosa]|uniref:OLC1v1001451C1 n=1 Tax=Oldenlandia corymbosa var. corymbosa TaxID=529605 RepID=A0AAV1D7K8_OLDCO|nr:OLC1v1001451C1 [Oldenlandia corymbosa var. corymbosa]
MKRLRSSEDLDSFGEKGVCKDWGRREDDSSSHRSLMHRNSYYKLETARKGLSSSSSRYDRVEDDRDSSRPARKRSDYDVDSYDRRKSYDRYREGTSEKGISSSSPRSGYSDRIHRSESFSGLRRDVPKGFRSERDRSRREGSVSSWRKFGQGKDGDDGSRSYNDSGKSSRLESDDALKIKSPRMSKDVKSPPWSKDSGSEQSKSIEVKRSEEMPVESSGNNSEMEEGELEPDPQPLPLNKNSTEDQASDRIQSSMMEHEQQDLLEEKGKSKSAENIESSKESRQDVREEGRSSDSFHASSKEGNELAECQDVSHLRNDGGDENETAADSRGSKQENVSRATMTYKEEISESQTLEEKGRELKTNEGDNPEQDNKLSEGTGECLAITAPVLEEINENLKDKGKTVALPASNCTPLTDQFKTVTELRGPLTNGDSYQEGTSTRGLDLFRRDPLRTIEKELQWSSSKPKDEKLTLDLSLSLPNVLLPIDSHNTAQAPASPSRGRSIQSFHSSFRTDSEGFTASMSFSGSQYFSHNPSCSLTHEAFDNEQSVKSRPLFQGVDWQALSSGEMKHKELPPIVQKLLAEENGLHQQNQASLGNSSSQAMAQPKITVEGSARTPVSLERHLSFSKQYSGGPSQLPNEIRSLSQGVGSQETGAGFLREKKQALREKGGGSLCKSINQEGREQQLNIGADLFESVMTSILSESLNMVSQRFSEMSLQQITFLKDSVHDFIQSPSGHRQLIAFQKALQRRSNITLEMLLKLHQSLLEILVALKTGLAEYLHKADITPSSLAEIFLNLRCRNPNCQSLLPVDECDCRICAQKNGFCRECMCLVCSKFDMASNTCSWVGCDVCLHWCHAECGLRESYIRNGRSATGSDSTTEMQFHCVACNHPSEMFGFVKEVFQNFAKDWTAENLSRELEHVRRIFSASEDLRGKQLHKVVIQMLLKLENKVNVQEVKQYIMSFLTDSDSLNRTNSTLVKVELSPRNDGKSNGVAGSSQEVQWPKSVTFDRTSQLDKSGGLFPSLDGSRNSKESERNDMQVSIPKEHGFDELESIVRIKHAESKMFQARADDARREAAALKRIATTKSERIEEEYTSRIAKLRLADAEEMRKQKIEELQALERAFQDYFHLKMRMETDIKDLLLKMDATRRNLNL